MRWQMLIEHHDQTDVVEIVTWNDYSELHSLTLVRLRALSSTRKDGPTVCLGEWPKKR
ncbi:hypothetical protein DAEQUDRAFT_724389 [Daedalea quercina L-15889]|uniref:Uncharacterized protein n=1 Tax=Daedalea quercina L-15889 TaxID=1314783 RepID=A0A165S1A6_9APHY|nr:hypothetical protein DAEQUDRAFT_724389 [Daedalea quercina L-15889]